MANTNYIVTVKTGNDKKSGTDCKVELKIIGSKGETSFHELNDPTHNDFENGDNHDYSISDIDVEDIEYLVLKVSQKFYDFSDPNWYIDYISVRKDNPTTPPKSQANNVNLFPIYQWITKSNHKKEIVISTNKTCKSQNENQLYKSCIAQS